jgi:hypothetical protein
VNQLNATAKKSAEERVNGNLAKIGRNHKDETRAVVKRVGKTATPLMINDKKMARTAFEPSGPSTQRLIRWSNVSRYREAGGGEAGGLFGARSRGGA